MGVIKYSNEILEFIKNEYLKGTSYKDISNLLYKKFNFKVSDECLRKQMQLKFKELLNKKPNNPFSKKEIQFIKSKVYKVKTIYELTNIFNKKFKSNRDRATIRKKLIQLNINRKWNKKRINTRRPYRHKYGDIFIEKKSHINKDNIKIITMTKYICINKKDIKMNNKNVKIYGTKFFKYKYNNYIYEKIHNIKVNNEDTIINIDGDINNISKDNLLLVNKNAIHCFRSNKYDEIKDFNIRKSAWLYCDLATRNNKFMKKE